MNFWRCSRLSGALSTTVAGMRRAWLGLSTSRGRCCINEVIIARASAGLSRGTMWPTEEGVVVMTTVVMMRMLNDNNADNSDDGDSDESDVRRRLKSRRKLQQCKQ